ncbi:COMM domain-containing protein 7, partial [Stegodyphus mimosarum]
MPDYQIFQKFNQEAFTELLDISFKSLTQKQQPNESFSRYKAVCAKSSIEFSDLEPAIQALLQTCRDGVKKCKPIAQLSDELLNLGMNADQVDIFSKKWEEVYSALVQTTAAETIHINPLIDMEWKFGVSSASNQLNAIGNVFLQIKLDLDIGNGRTKSVCFELQLSEFYAFLHEMERAR